MRDAAPDLARGWSAPVALALGVLACAYAAAIHHGLGPAPSIGGAWWQPSAFLRSHETVRALGQAPLPGVVGAAAPAALVLFGLYLRPAPAIARALAAAATACAAILAFYGLQPSAFGVWTFFGWRGSAVMTASGVLIGLAFAAPDLARSLRRLPLLVGAVLYGVAFVGVAGLIRNATGWDPTLSFNISPWPAIPVLALEIGVYAWTGALLGMAIATASAAAARTTTARVVGLALGIGVPIVWFAARFPYTGGALLAAGAVLATALVAIAHAGTAGDRRLLAERAGALGLGAALVALPLVTGRALADGDFAVSKHVRARVVSDALAAYYDDEGIYPETLDELVEVDLLSTLPRPRVGSGFWDRFGLTDRPVFDYRNLGSSYVLEFVATEWVMCSYTPPWEDDFEDEATYDEDDAVASEAAYLDCLRVCNASCDDADRDCDAYCTDACEVERAEQAAIAEASAADDGGEAWSCPDSRPELW